MRSHDLLLLGVAAWRYSAAYLLAGGGVVGAIVVYIGAKMLRK